MISSIKKYAYYLLVNVLVAVVILALIDFAITGSYFVRNAKKYGTSDKMTCDAKLTGYDYCPSLVQVNFMDKRDRVMPIYNYIDANRRSEYKNKKTIPVNSGKGTVFILGDSFVQADELEIQERFEHMLRQDGYSVVAYGYSSWNSWQFSRISEKIPVRSCDRVIIFSMTNDYTPSYGNSTIQVLKKFKSINDEEGSNLKKGWIDDYIGQSFLFNRIFADLFKYIESEKNQVDTKTVNASSWHQYPLNCESIKNRLFPSSEIGYDYLYLSQENSCWPSNVVESVDLNISILKNIKNSIEKRGARVDIFMVPAGWAFKNQNTVGRMANDYQFSFPVPQTGLVNYINSQGLPVTDLLPILEHGSVKDNDLYFAVDGHWTSFAHEIIYQHLKSSF